jgi:hypothetical protein
MGKKSGSGSGMNNPNHISESLEIILLKIQILKFFDAADPGWGKKIRIRIQPGKKRGRGMLACG